MGASTKGPKNRYWVRKMAVCETDMIVAQTDLTHHDRGEDSGHRIGELVDGEGCVTPAGILFAVELPCQGGVEHPHDGHRQQHQGDAGMVCPKT